MPNKNGFEDVGLDAAPFDRRSHHLSACPIPSQTQAAPETVPATSPSLGHSYALSFTLTQILEENPRATL